MLICEDNDRTLVNIREIEGFRGNGEGLLMGSWRQNNLGELSVPQMDREIEVLLGGTGGKASGRTGPLGVDDDDGSFIHACHRYRFPHEG